MGLEWGVNSRWRIILYPEHRTAAYTDSCAGSSCGSHCRYQLTVFDSLDHYPRKLDSAIRLGLLRMRRHTAGDVSHPSLRAVCNRHVIGSDSFAADCRLWKQ